MQAAQWLSDGTKEGSLYLVIWEKLPFALGDKGVTLQRNDKVTRKQSSSEVSNDLGYMGCKGNKVLKGNRLPKVTRQPGNWRVTKGCRWD